MRPPDGPIIPVELSPHPLEVRKRIHALIGAGNTVIRVEVHNESATAASFKIVYSGPPLFEWLYDVEVDK